MKKICSFISVLFLFANIFLSIKSNAQPPERISYQAVIRDDSNQLVVNKQIGMRISIQKYIMGIPPTYQNVYIETQKPTTNENGLISIQIGGGSIVGGTFKSINWGDGTYYIKTETDPTSGTNYTITGMSQILSIPYAFNSNSAVQSETAKSAEIADTAKSITAYYQSNESNLKFGFYPIHSGYPYTLPLRISNTDLGLTESEMYNFHIISMEVGWGDPVSTTETKQIRGPKDGIYYEICYPNSGFTGVKIYFPDKQEYWDRDGQIIYVLAP